MNTNIIKWPGGTISYHISPNGVVTVQTVYYLAGFNVIETKIESSPYVIKSVDVERHEADGSVTILEPGSADYKKAMQLKDAEDWKTSMHNKEQ